MTEEQKTDLLKEAETHVKSLIKIATDLSDTAKLSVERIRKYEEAEEEARIASEKVIKTTDDLKKSLESTRKQLADEIESFRKTKSPLQKELDDLLQKTADLKVENTKLRQANDRFKSYEAKAQKILEAKDKSLIERERALEQQEGLKPRSKTFLPTT